MAIGILPSLVISIGSLAIAALIYFLQRILSRSSKKLPKLNPESLFFTFGKFANGLALDLLMNNTKRMGKVFRLNMPLLEYLVAICDADLARKIYEEEAEKIHLYKNFDGITMHRSTIFTKYTYGENWEMNRKGLASSFSSINLAKSLPLLYKKCDELMTIFDHFSVNGEVFEITELMLSMAIDFIGIAMFGIDLRCMSDDKTSVGKQILTEMTIATKEYALKVIAILILETDLPLVLVIIAMV